MIPGPQLDPPRPPRAPGPRPTARRTVARVRLRATAALAMVLVSGVVLAGCGLRVDTPPPPPVIPGVNESARQRANADASALGVLGAVPGADPADPVAAVRADVVAHANAHLDQLGPLPGATTPPTPNPSPAATTGGTPATATPEAVLAQLVQAAANAQRDAVTVPDGALARLLASVSVERLVLARRLATVAALTVPDLPAVAVPEAAPAGVPASGLSALVADEDEAGYGFEVIAAKLSGSDRTRALARATVHRNRAEAWATLAAIARTGLDPRRTAYAVPAAVDDPAVATALAQTLELSLAASYASLVADAEPASRSGLVDTVVEATDAAASWGPAVPAFPGMPDLATAG